MDEENLLDYKKALEELVSDHRSYIVRYLPNPEEHQEFIANSIVRNPLEYNRSLYYSEEDKIIFKDLFNSEEFKKNFVDKLFHMNCHEFENQIMYFLRFISGRVSVTYQDIPEIKEYVTMFLDYLFNVDNRWEKCFMYSKLNEIVRVEDMKTKADNIYKFLSITGTLCKSLKKDFMKKEYLDKTAEVLADVDETEMDDYNKNYLTYRKEEFLELFSNKHKDIRNIEPFLTSSFMESLLYQDFNTAKKYIGNNTVPDLVNMINAIYDDYPFPRLLNAFIWNYMTEDQVKKYIFPLFDNKKFDKRKFELNDYFKYRNFYYKGKKLFKYESLNDHPFIVTSYLKFNT